MAILVTGLVTVHWGRLEFGNIGNYYIVEPFFRQLHRVFPDEEIITTFQMTDEFIQRERITVIPMETYYAWRPNELALAKQEYKIAQEYHHTKELSSITPYIDVLRKCRLLVDISGDMWGDNANHIGENRFEVELLKLRTAQLLGVKTVLFAVTPGPFTDPHTTPLAKEVIKNCSMVSNREAKSCENMLNWGFEPPYMKDFACPAFLFEPCEKQIAKELFQQDHICLDDGRPVVGFTIGGFNMPVAPYDLWPRSDDQYTVFVHAVEHLVNNLNAHVVMISHTNGFDVPPKPFRLINGRDYPILNQLREILLKRGKVSESDVSLVQTPHLPKEVKAMIGCFDLMITGRVHASVAAVSQCVPTVFLTYEQSWIPSSKMYGFSELVGLSEYVCEPSDEERIIACITKAFENRKALKASLEQRIPEVQNKARESFDALTQL